jgi:hypothetical protein
VLLTGALALGMCIQWSLVVLFSWATKCRQCAVGTQGLGLMERLHDSSRHYWL